jgi:hypothetical protein
VLRGLGEFDYTLRAGAGSSRYRLAEPTPDIRAGSEDVELRVVEGVEISGRLVAADGLPVRAVQIRGIQTDGSSAVFHLSRPDGGDGGFVLRGLVSGEVKVQADFGSGFVDLGTVQVPAEASSARVLFRSSGHLR